MICISVSTFEVLYFDETLNVVLIIYSWTIVYLLIIYSWSFEVLRPSEFGRENVRVFSFKNGRLWVESVKVEGPDGINTFI